MCCKNFFFIFLCVPTSKKIYLFFVGGLTFTKKAILLSKGKQVKIPASSHGKAECMGCLLFCWHFVFLFLRWRILKPQDGDHTLGKSSLFFANTGNSLANSLTGDRVFPLACKRTFCAWQVSWVFRENCGDCKERGLKRKKKRKMRGRETEWGNTKKKRFPWSVFEKMFYLIF